MKRHLAEKTQMKKKRTAGSAIGFAVSATVWTAESLLLRSSGKVRTKDARVKFSQTGGSQRHPTKLRRLAVRTQEQDVDLSGALPWFVPEKISEKEKKGRLPLRRLRKNARGETMLGCRLLTGQLFGYLSWLWTLSIHEYHDTSKALPDSSNFSTITSRQTQVEHPADLSLLASCVVAARDFKSKWKTNTGR